MHAHIVRVVATLLDNQDLVANLAQSLGHPKVHKRAKIGPANTVSDRCVETATDNNHIWAELSGQRQNNSLKSQSVLARTEAASFVVLTVYFIHHAASLPRDIHVEARTFAFANEAGLPIISVGEESPFVSSMDAY